jgi:8-oxo-dGTP pyrophosphatase MutT (NUDIX family)
MLQDVIDEYLKLFPEERAGLAQLIKQVAANEALNDRKNFNGHITGSALVISPDRKKLLVVYHKLFQLWIQPGGHWDPGESDPWSAARREAEEETSVQIAEQLIPEGLTYKIPLYMGEFPIPPRPDKNEPPHVHHDFRYAYLAKTEELSARLSEVDEVRWLPFAEAELLDGKINVERLRHFGLIA